MERRKMVHELGGKDMGHKAVLRLQNRFWLYSKQQLEN